MACTMTAVAACVIGLNALNARPEDTQTGSRKVVRAVLAKNTDLKPVYSGNMFFIHNLRPNPWRSLASTALSMAEVASHFKKPQPTLVKLMTPPASKRRLEEQPNNNQRRPKKKQRVGTVANVVASTSMDAQRPLQDPSGAPMVDFDLEDLAADYLPPDGYEDTNNYVKQLWLASAADIFSIFPTQGKHSKWTKDTFKDDEQTPNSTFKQPFKVLDSICEAYRVFDGAVETAKVTRWDSVFNLLWPAKGFVPTDKNHDKQYGKMVYWRSWQLFMSNVTDDDATAIRKKVKEEFDTMRWMPFAKTDRVWKTGNAQKSLHDEGGIAGPWAIHNPLFPIDESDSDSE